MSNLSFLNTIATRTHFFFKATRAAFVSAVPNERPSEDSRIFSTLSMPSALQTRIACSARSSSRPRSQTANASQQVCRIFTVTFLLFIERYIGGQLDHGINQSQVDCKAWLTPLRSWWATMTFCQVANLRAKGTASKN